MSTTQKKHLVVLGATGTQGGAVLRYFAQHHHNNFILSGITRNPGSAASQALQNLGVNVLKADANDLSSLQEAFSNATHIFATTDSNQNIFDFIKHPEKLGAGETPLTKARGIEEQQGRNIVAAAAATSTLERIVWSSLGSPAKWSGGRLSKVAMFDAKETIADMFWAEEKLKSKLSILVIGFYSDNALKVPEMYGLKKQSDGVYEMSLPMSGDVPVPHADVESDTGAWVSALFSADPGTTLLGASEMLTWNQWIQVWAESAKVEARFRQVPSEDFAKRMPGISEAVAEEFQFVEEYGLAGANPDAVLPEQARQRGIAIRDSSMRSAIERLDWSSVL